MADEEQKDLGPVSADNLSQHIERLDAKRESATPAPAVTPPVTQTATPAAAPTESTPTESDEDWWEKGLATDHAWLRAKKGEQVSHAFVRAQQKINNQRDENKTLREELERLRSGSHLQPTQAVAPVTVAQQSDDDPRKAEYELVFYTNPDRAREIMLEWAEERIDAKRAAERFTSETETHRNAAVTAATSAAEQVMKAYGLESAAAQKRMATAVANELREQADKVFAEFGGNSGDPEAVARATDAWRDVWTNQANYIAAYEAIYGAPSGAVAPVVTAPVTTPRAEPPGSKAQAPSAPRRAASVAPASSDEDRALAQLAEAANLKGDSVKRFSERARRAS